MAKHRHHHSKKAHRRSKRAHRRHTHRRGGGHGGLGGGSGYTSGAAQELKQMVPAPIRGGMRRIGRTLKRLLHL